MDSKLWADRLRVDLTYLQNTVHSRIRDCLALLDPSTTDPKTKSESPWARRIVRANGAMDFLHKKPRLDAEYLGSEGMSEDRSAEIEDAIDLLADKMNALRVVRRMHHTCAWSPVAFGKVYMPQLQIADTTYLSETVPHEFPQQKSRFVELPDDLAGELGLLDETVREMSIPQQNISEPDILPTPKTSLDVPVVTWVDPRHMIVPSSTLDFDHAPYVGQLILIPLKKFRDGDFINKDEVTSYYMGYPEGTTAAIATIGRSLCKTFSYPTNTDVVILVELWVREDPDSNARHQVGTLDLISGLWVRKPRPNPLSVFPYVALQASDEVPGLWNAFSYIEQGMDDIRDAAWSRRKMRQHVDAYSSHKQFIPTDVELDAENQARLEDPDYNGPIYYTGNRKPSPVPVPTVPTGLIQWMLHIDDQFNRNTGITSTMQGHGASNKVATAFTAEERYAAERRGEIRYRVYDAFGRVMLLATFLVQRYLIDPIQIQRNGVQFFFSRDVVAGVMGYKVDVVESEQLSTFEGRMMQLQTIRQVLATPGLAEQFDMKELARRVAALAGWGPRAIRRGGDATQAQNPQGSQPTGPAPQDFLGDGVDSEGNNGNTISALMGAQVPSSNGQAQR